MGQGRKSGWRWLPLACLWLATPAAAQLSNANGVLDVRASTGIQTMSACSREFNGDVEVHQDDARLRADRLVQYASKQAPESEGDQACGDTERLEAHGHVYYASGDRHVRGDDAVYEAASETLTITGDVILVQGQDVLRCARVVVNTRTGDARSEGLSASGAPGRIRAVIHPKARASGAEVKGAD
jgi:lipopolysaccharide export system protein LptA